MTDARPAVERRQPPKGPFVVVNALMRAVLGSRLPDPTRGRIALLSFTGRKTGRRYRTPVGVHDLDGTLVTLTSSGWRKNFRGGAPVTLRRGGTDPLTANLTEDPEQVADTYVALIGRFGHDKAARRLGIRINVDRAPTHDELADAARRSGLSVVTYQPRAR